MSAAARAIAPHATRGYRNRNPGNIEHVPANKWQGLADPPSDGRFCRFTSHELGIRALAALLVTYQDRHKLRTPRAIIERWAPKVENDTAAYIAVVARRIGASIVGDLRTVLAHEVRAGERAAMTAIRAETEQVKAELRRQVTTAFSGNARGIANAWRSMIFPRSGQSLRPAGLVFTKVPKIVDAFERGALIRAKSGGKFLAIPTGFNAARGRRGRGAKGMRVTPAQMVASGQAFLRPFKSGRGFVWCLPLRQGEQTGRRRRTRLVAGGVTEVGTANRKGHEAWARGLLEQGMVPMFLLLPQVKLAKRLDVRGAAERGLRRLPGRFVAAWERESGRTA